MVKSATQGILFFLFALLKQLILTEGFFKHTCLYSLLQPIVWFENSKIVHTINHHILVKSYPISEASDKKADNLKFSTIFKNINV